MKIAVIGAMEAEIQPLKAELNHMTEMDWPGGDYYLGFYGGHEICLLKSGIGKVNATLGATLLLELFKPDYVINIGSAGGLKSGMAVGDLVIASEVTHHDADLTAFGYAPGQLPEMPPTFTSDSLLIDKVTTALEETHFPHGHAVGLIGSGDSFVHDPQLVAQIQQKFPQMIAVEMEAAAIAQTCYIFNTPFVIIRALSDIAGAKSPMSFEEFLPLAAKNSVTLVQQILHDLAP